MKKTMTKTSCTILVLIISVLLGMLAVLGACSPAPSNSSNHESHTSAQSASQKSKADKVVENGQYTDKNSVAYYVHTFGHLPSNYVSKTKARKAGWVSSDGNL